MLTLAQSTMMLIFVPITPMTPLTGLALELFHADPVREDRWSHSRGVLSAAEGTPEPPQESRESKVTNKRTQTDTQTNTLNKQTGGDNDSKPRVSRGRRRPFMSYSGVFVFIVRTIVRTPNCFKRFGCHALYTACTALRNRVEAGWLVHTAGVHSQLSIASVLNHLMNSI